MAEVEEMEAPRIRRNEMAIAAEPGAGVREIERPWVAAPVSLS